MSVVGRHLPGLEDPTVQVLGRGLVPEVLPAQEVAVVQAVVQEADPELHQAVLPAEAALRKEG